VDWVTSGAELMSYTSNITCKTCGVEKDKSLFRRSGKSASGYTLHCHDCVNSKCSATASNRVKKPTIKHERDLTLEILFDVLELNDIESVFYRKTKSGLTPAGYTSDAGYTIIAICGRDFRAHRLVWFIKHEEFPPDGFVVDHVNRNPQDNRISNLRVVAQKINSHNIVNPKRNNSSGYLGVRKFRKRYTARIYYPNGKELQIGTFDTAQQAHAAYVLQKQIFYPEAVIA
jgi:hypothetical protein